jgi:hypothetical protein
MNTFEAGFGNLLQKTSCLLDKYDKLHGNLVNDLLILKKDVNLLKSICNKRIKSPYYTFRD